MIDKSDSAGILMRTKLPFTGAEKWRGGGLSAFFRGEEMGGGRGGWCDDGSIVRIYWSQNNRQNAPKAISYYIIF